MLFAFKILLQTKHFDSFGLFVGVLGESELVDEFLYLVTTLFTATLVVVNSPPEKKDEVTFPHTKHGVFHACVKKFLLVVWLVCWSLG